MILALDIGSKLGFYGTHFEKACTLTLGKPKCDSRFVDFYHFLLGLKDTYTHIAYEDAAFQQGAAIPIYHGLVGILKAYCLHNDIPLYGIPVGTIKKCFTGKGNTNKAGMMARCDALGIEYDDDNGSDAYAVYYTYKKLYEGK